MIKSEISKKIIVCAFEVMNNLGTGFLEKVYENAMMKEFELRGIKVEQQKAIKVYYKGNVVGEYIADMLVEDEIIVELKIAKELTNVHLAQGINYLKGTNKRLCLLLNFGKVNVEIKRVIL